MFYKKDLTKVIEIAPAHFGKNLRNVIRAQLIAQVEGTTIEKFGTVVAVMAVEDRGISRGVINHLTGSAKFTVTFIAVLFRPFKGEVCDGIVKSVTPLGCYVEVGPYTVLVVKFRMGGLLHNAQENTWQSKDRTRTVNVGKKVRLRLVSTPTQSSEMNLIGDMHGDGLGPLA